MGTTRCLDQIIESSLDEKWIPIKIYMGWKTDARFFTFVYMADKYVNIPYLSTEFVFQVSRSSGPGGQNVNKVNTRVALRFDIVRSGLLSVEQKEVLLDKLSSKITDEGVLQVVSQKERSQLMNKEACIEKIYTMLEKVLTPPKKRKATRPTRISVEKRIQGKKLLGEKKSLRGKVDF